MNEAGVQREVPSGVRAQTAAFEPQHPGVPEASRANAFHFAVVVAQI